MKIIEHDPEAVLDYRWDWSLWLDENEAITSATVEVDFPDADVAIALVSFEASGVTAWVNGGRPGRTYPLVCHIATNSGREDDRTILLECTER